MNHDITHCKGIGCPVKHNCLRYVAHTEVKKCDIPYLPYTTEMYDHGDCPMYVRARRVPN